MTQRCLCCRRQISFRERSRGVVAVSLAGFPRARCAALMPRCPECLARHVDGARLTPASRVRALTKPVTALQLPAEDWDAVHHEIVSRGCDFVAARLPSPQGAAVAVVTTATFPDMKTTEPGVAADWIEGYISRRPPQADPRFVASPAWTPFREDKDVENEPAPADAGSAAE